VCSFARLLVVPIDGARHQGDRQKEALVATPSAPRMLRISSTRRGLRYHAQRWERHQGCGPTPPALCAGASVCGAGVCPAVVCPRGHFPASPCSLTSLSASPCSLPAPSLSLSFFLFSSSLSFVSLLVFSLSPSSLCRLVSPASARRPPSRRSGDRSPAAGSREPLRAARSSAPRPPGSDAPAATCRLVVPGNHFAPTLDRNRSPRPTPRTLALGSSSRAARLPVGGSREPLRSARARTPAPTCRW